MTETTMDAAGGRARDARERRASILYAGAASALAFGIFGPILYHMVRHWAAVDDYSHGFLVVPLALYFAWERRRELQRATLRPSWWGLIPLALGSLALMIGRLGVELTAMRASFVLTLIGLQILLLGRDVSITRIRGTWQAYCGIPLMPTFHPAYLLRQYTPENRRVVWEDLKAALARSRQ